MRISILNDTSKNSNWGCAATVHGLRQSLAYVFNPSVMDSIELQPLPYKKIKLLRNRSVSAVARCLADPQHTTGQLATQLEKLNFKNTDGPLPDLLVLNGEGGIHSKSGHLMRFLGVAKLFKELGARVSAVNQSVDLGVNSREAKILGIVYRSLDFVSVREPISLRLLQQIGVHDAVLVPDAAFSVTLATQDEKNEVASRLELPERYVCLTGSSDITKRSGNIFLKLYECLKQVSGLPVVMMASTKTDRALAKILRAHDPSVMVMTDDYDYRSALAVISGADLLVGGRFHPTIFAAREGTPVVPFKGNTHKMEGLMELLSYPIDPIDWHDLADCETQIKYALNDHQALGQLLAVNSEQRADEVIRLAV